MKLLVDTHTFLWSLISPARLGSRARESLTSSENEVFLSAVSLWEISLKISLGKMQLEGISLCDLPQLAESAGYLLLALDPRVAAGFWELPRVAHKDPFDRMLIWQCINGNMVFVSKDSKILEYKKFGLRRIW